jgi:hypothetical protein
MKITFLLLCSIFSYSQEYYYDNSFIRDNLGRFQPLNKNGYFEIGKDSVCLFDQRLKIISSRKLFDKKTIYEGQMYTCSDGHYFYTFYLTTNNELYFYTKKEEMIKFILKLVETLNKKL